MDAPKAKITVTLDQDVLAQIRVRVAAGQARSVSAFLQHAVQGQLAAEADFDAVVDQVLAATGGPATEAERAAAQLLLSGSAA